MDTYRVYDSVDTYIVCYSMDICSVCHSVDTYSMHPIQWIPTVWVIQQHIQMDKCTANTLCYILLFPPIKMTSASISRHETHSIICQKYQQAIVSIVGPSWIFVAI